MILLGIRLTRPQRGLGTLQLLRLDPMTAQTPIIVCTADVVIVREQMNLLEALHVIVQEKPFTIQELIGKIQQALDGGTLPVRR